MPDETNKTGRLTWDDVGEKKYEMGVSKGVIYLQDKGIYPEGVPWNGLTGVDESPSGAEPTPLWADNSKYGTLMSAEEFAATVTAYTYPDEFMECDGSKEIAPGVYAGQQNRRPFGFCYRTEVGNDTEGDQYGYKIHVVYGGLASPSDKSFASVNDSPEVVDFSWEISTTPVPVPNSKPTATLIFDSSKIPPDTMKEIENILYGSDAVEAVEADGENPAIPASPAQVAHLPLPKEFIELLAKG